MQYETTQCSSGHQNSHLRDKPNDTIHIYNSILLKEPTHFIYVSYVSNMQGSRLSTLENQALS